MARAARGNGMRLFVYSALLGAVVAMFFANDGAALILTPIVYEQVKALRLPPASLIAFVMAGGFIADTTSLPLVVSNLVNIVSADFFHIGFLRYAAAMLPVDVVALCGERHRTLPLLPALPAQGGPVAGPSGSGDRTPRSSALPRRNLAPRPPVPRIPPERHPAHPGLDRRDARRRASAAARAAQCHGAGPWILREAPWKIVVFSLGMYIVVFGLRDAGLIALLGRSVMAAPHGLASGILYTGYLAGSGSSSVMNNMPTVMVNALAIHATGAPGRSAGHGLRQRHRQRPRPEDHADRLTRDAAVAARAGASRAAGSAWGYYFRVGVTLTLPVLAVTLLALVGVLQFVH